jgi:hypothetical protein
MLELSHRNVAGSLNKNRDFVAASRYKTEKMLRDLTIF